MNLLRVSQYILGRRYVYFIKKVKIPLRKALIKLASDGVSWIGAALAIIHVIRLIRKYPEPTKENTVNSPTIPNIHMWIDLWDDFLQWEDDSVKDPLGQVVLFRTLRRLHLGTYAHDTYYGQRNDRFFELWVEKYLNGEYQPLPEHLPSDRWKEPSRLEAWNKMVEERKKRADWLDRIREKVLGGVGDEKTA